MLTLNLSPQVVTVALPGGASLVCRPVSTAIIFSAQAAAASAAREADELAADDVADDVAEDVPPSFMIQWVIEAARLAVFDWTGIGNADGKPLNCTPEHVVALIEQQPQVYQAFRDGYFHTAFALVAEGNG